MSVVISADTVNEVLATLENAFVRVWLDGGWGVDALLGTQTRSHEDLDLIVSLTDVSKLQEALRSIDFQVTPDATPANFVMADKHGRKIDVHPIELDERGNGFFWLPDGRRWPFPSAAFAGQGSINDRNVRCLSVDAQVQCHAQGYEPREKDLHDMEQLQKRFGVVLPISLCRQADVDVSRAAQRSTPAEAPDAQMHARLTKPHTADG